MAELSSVYVYFQMAIFAKFLYAVCNPLDWILRHKNCTKLKKQQDVMALEKKLELALGMPNSKSVIIRCSLQ